MSGHTPGPWVADENGVGGSHDRHGAWFGVGPMGDALGRGFDVALVEKQADARLIAAAPDLLAALERVVAESSKPSDPDAERWDQDITKADHWVQEALRKARGQ